MRFSEFINEMRVVSPKENIYQICDALGAFVYPKGKETVPTDQIHSQINGTPDDWARVKALAEQIGSPKGYIERIIIDEQGHVVEGQHRFEALKMLGYKNIPVYRIINFETTYNIPKIKEEVFKVMPLYGDRMTMFIKAIFENVIKEGSVMGAREYTFQSPDWQRAYEAALDVMEGK